MLLYNRRDSVNLNLAPRAEMWGWYFFRHVMLKRTLVDFFSGSLKNFFLKHLFSASWSKRRVMPVVAKESFSNQWTRKENKISAK